MALAHSPFISHLHYSIFQPLPDRVGAWRLPYFAANFLDNIWKEPRQMITVLFILIFSVIRAQLINPVRHYDFVASHRVQIDFDKSIHLSFQSFNKTYTFKLDRNNHLLLAESAMHIQHALTGKTSVSSIHAHPYHGTLLDESELEIGHGRILFHKE